MSTYAFDDELSLAALSNADTLVSHLEAATRHADDLTPGDLADLARLLATARAIQERRRWEFYDAPPACVTDEVEEFMCKRNQK